MPLTLEWVIEDYSFGEICSSVTNTLEPIITEWNKL